MTSGETKTPFKPLDMNPAESRLNRFNGLVKRIEALKPSSIWIGTDGSRVRKISVAENQNTQLIVDTTSKMTDVEGEDVLSLRSIGSLRITRGPQPASEDSYLHLSTLERDPDATEQLLRNIGAAVTMAENVQLSYEDLQIVGEAA